MNLNMYMKSSNNGKGVLSMKWEKIGKRCWMQQITDTVYCILMIQEYLNQTPLQTSRSFGLKVMTVDIVKHANEIRQIRRKYQGFFIGSEVEPNMAKMYVLENGKDVVKVKEEDYKVLQSHVKNYYGIEVPDREEVSL